MKIIAYKCPKCKDLVYSRAQHDLRSCSCGAIFVDGGFEYTRIGFNKTPPESVEIEVHINKKELYMDWNFNINKYGIIKGE